MEASTTRFASASIVLLLSVIAMLASANADPGYGKSQLEAYVPPKPDTPKEHVTYEKTKPKVPTKPVVPKKEYVTYEKTKPKLSTKPVVPKYEKNYPKLPTKPVVPKKEHESYEKSNPKLPTKPVLPKGQYGSYPTKPVVPKPENKTYGKSHPKAPKVLEHPKNIAVQGLIYCKYGAKLLPLQGTYILCDT